MIGELSPLQFKYVVNQSMRAVAIANEKQLPSIIGRKYGQRCGIYSQNSPGSPLSPFSDSRILLLKTMKPSDQKPAMAFKAGAPLTCDAHGKRRSN